MQNLVPFTISSLVANLGNLANFFSQFGSFCTYYPCWCCNCFFAAIGKELDKIQKQQNRQDIFNNSAEFFCMDIKDIAIKKNGDRDYLESPLKTIRGNGGGIFIFFNRTTNEVLLVGFSEDLYPPKGDQNSDIKFARYITNNNKVMNKYFEEYFDRLNTPDRSFSHLSDDEKKKEFREYINGYSILFLCLKLSNPKKYKDVLKDLREALKAVLNPTIPDDE